MQQDYDSGKYTVIFNERTGALHALRNGEVWKDLSGNNLVYWMLVEHKRALERIAELEKDAARYMEICKRDHEDRNWVDSFEEYKAMRDKSIDTTMQGA